jgi:hypothetical protein
MTLTIQPYAADSVEAVKALNARLREHGVPYQFPDDPTPDWLPPGDGATSFHEYFVAKEGANVRGGYIFKQQSFFVTGELRPIGFFRLPLSEGSYDKRYSALAAQFLLHALKKNPHLFSLGIGGYDEPLAKMEASVGWTQWTVPFLFRVEHPFAFLRNIRHLRRKPQRRLLLDLLAITGLGRLGLHTHRLVERLRGRTKAVAADYCEVSFFGSWTDDVWTAAKDHYSLIAERTSAELQRLFPLNDSRYIRLQVLDGGRTIGWAVVLDTQHTGHKHFGDMRLGSLVDFLAVPGSEAQVVAAATQCLSQRGVDLVVVNTAHDAWVAALRSQGYLSGPSNFIFSASKKLVELLQPFDEQCRRVHLTRGDGDGPIHL